MGWLGEIVSNIRPRPLDLEAKVEMLRHLPETEFTEGFRGVDPATVDRLFLDVKAHEPIVSAAASSVRMTGVVPSDQQTQETLDYLSTVGSFELRVQFRGYDASQVEKILLEIRRIPGDLERAAVDFNRSNK